MVKMVTINLFDVDMTPQTCQRLSDTLDEYKAMTLDKRWRNDIRLEQVVKMPKNPSLGLPDFYQLDFAKKREVGPGKLGNAIPVSGIQMQKGEDFGEETAAIYVPSKKWLLVLNNQAGIGPTRMSEYFNAVDPGSSRHFAYSANPRLDPTILNRLRGMSNLTSLNITATVDALDATQDKVGLAVAMATRPLKAERISITLGANKGRARGSFLNNKTVMTLVRKLRGQGSDVTVLKIKGEDPTTGKKDQVIDLLEHKIKRQFNADELKVIDHRYTIQSRWDLLSRALRGWV
jgi:aryl carrier-like protein